MSAFSKTFKKYGRNNSPEPAAIHVERAGSAATSIVDIDEAEEANIVELGIWETIRNHPNIIFCCIFANLGALMYGFDNISLSLCLTMGPFVETFGTNGVIPASWQSMWNALAQLATGIGAFLAGPLSDRFGRKASFGVSGVLSAIGVAIVYTSSTPGSFLVGKIVNAFGLGMALTAGQIYISEITPLKIRGAALNGYAFCTNVGYLVAASIAFKRVTITDDSSYKVLFAAEWVWPGLLLLGFLFIPESPFHLVRKGKLDQAKSSFRTLYSKPLPVEPILARAVRLIREENFVNNSESSYMDCFKGSNARRTRIILWANALPQMIGTTFISNAPYFMITAGLSSSNSSMMIEIGIAFAIMSSGLTFWLMTFIGRRKMILCGFGAAAILYLAMGIVACFPLTSPSLWTIGILLQLVWWTVGPGLGPAFSIAGEVSSVRLRAKSQALGFLFNYSYSTIWNVVVPYMFNTNYGNLGGKMGWIFFTTCAISLVVVFLDFPETMNRGFDELDEMFEEGVPARKFKDYVTSRQSRGAEKIDLEAKVQQIEGA